MICCTASLYCVLSFSCIASILYLILTFGFDFVEPASARQCSSELGTALAYSQPSSSLPLGIPKGDACYHRDARRHSPNNLSSSNSDATRQYSSELDTALAAPSLGLCSCFVDFPFGRRAKPSSVGSQNCRICISGEGIFNPSVTGLWAYRHSSRGPGPNADRKRTQNMATRILFRAILSIRLESVQPICQREQ